MDWSEPAAISETHVSVVVFVGERAFKVKKPVVTDFLDFSDPDRRAEVCHHEVDLNRRLAPDVYLGVATLTLPDGTAEPVVVMRRLPPETRLSTLVEQGEPLRSEIRSVARQVAILHEAAATGGAVDEAASPEAIAAGWEQNLEEMSSHRDVHVDGARLDRVDRLAHHYLAGRRTLLEERVEAGWARDGHGDLLADDVFCLPDGPRILDCIEFDDTLRYGDVLADLAFLAMDLERLGRPDLADALLADYEEFTAERHPPTLAHHYVAARALIRSKVSCIRATQGDETAGARARSLLAMAEARLEQAQVPLVLVGGLPGTGKSTLAAGLAATRDHALLRSDVVRRERTASSASGSRDGGHRSGGYRSGAYTPELTDATYAELVSRARSLLERGRPVVVDASWTAARHRRLAAELAEEVAAPLVALECTAPREITHGRIADRLAADHDPSEATPEIAEAMAGDADPWPEAVTIDASGTPADTLRQALDALDAVVART